MIGMTVRRTAPGFLLLLALAVPGTAAAHATLVRTIPANGAVLAQAPAGIRLLFDDGVRPLGGAVAIRNGGGSVLAGKPRLERGSRHVVVVPLRRALPVGD